MNKMTTYRRIDAIRVSINILRFLAEQKELISGQDVARAMELPYGTVMCHLSTLEDEHLVRCVGGAWEFDMGIAIFWARKKAQLETRIARDTKNLQLLGE